MAIELKTDSWHRYVLYRNGATSLMPFASSEDKHVRDQGWPVSILP
jgi:hypothetical protein